MTPEDLEKQALIDQIDKEKAEIARLEADINRMLQRLKQLDNGIDKGI